VKHLSGGDGFVVPYSMETADEIRKFLREQAVRNKNMVVTDKFRLP
jgi:hypothetical protein